MAPNSTELAVANGDTRTATFSHQHTNEPGSFTYMVNGVYDQAALDKLNWFMPRLAAQRVDRRWTRICSTSSGKSIANSGSPPADQRVFRLPLARQTNAMLRRRRRKVAEHSQHMQGKAIDAHFEDVGPGRIRDIAMRMQDGGVGFYPSGL